MDRKELETYQVQLTQVEAALETDPDNAELSSLRDELKELVTLTEAALAQAESTSKPDTSRKRDKDAAATHSFSAGDECLAKYSGDNSWYPARVASVGGSTDNRVYSVVFKGYNTTEVLNAALLKPLPPNYNVAAHVSNKRKLTREEEEERERKKKKNEKKLETRAAKSKEQSEKQQSWQKFAKKAEKKGVHIAGTAGSSIFRTPDNPLGRGERRSSPPVRRTVY